VLGAGLYSYVKNKYADQTKQIKSD
jgi:hypothetical protein